MCWATQQPQVPHQGQIGVARSGAGLSLSTSAARLPSDVTSVRSPGRAPGTIAPLAAIPCPCASSATIETSSSASAMARADQKFPRTGAAEDRRQYETERGPALCFDRRAHALARALERCLVFNPPFDEIAPAEFELRLDEADEPRPLCGELEHMRQHQALRNEAHVQDDRLRRVTEHLSCKGAGVDAFKRTNAGIRGEARIELSVPDIKGDDLSRAARKQDIGKASGRRADVEADEARRIERERVERGGKLDPAARRPGMGSLGFNRRVTRNLFGGPLKRDPVDADQPSRNRRLGARPARKETAFHKKNICAFAHGAFNEARGAVCQ